MLSIINLNLNLVGLLKWCYDQPQPWLGWIVKKLTIISLDPNLDELYIKMLNMISLDLGSFKTLKSWPYQTTNQPYKNDIYKIWPDQPNLLGDMYQKPTLSHGIYQKLTLSCGICKNRPLSVDIYKSWPY